MSDIFDGFLEPTRMNKSALPLGIGIMSTSLILGFGILIYDNPTVLSQVDFFDRPLSDSVQSISVPIDYETRINKGDAYFKSAYYEQAAQEYEQAISLHKENPEAYLKLGLTYMELDENSKAIDPLKTANNLDPEDPEIALQYGLSLMRNGQLDQAREMLLSLGDATQDLLFYQGMLQSYYEEDENALKKWNRALDMNGNIEIPLIQNFLQAYDAYNAQQGPERVYLNALLTQAIIDAEEYELARDFALKTLAERSDYRDVWVLLGYAQLQIGNDAEAEEAFYQASQLDSLKSETYYFLGIARNNQEKYSEAVNAFEKALLHGFEPELTLYEHIADAYLHLENHEEALSAYEYLVQIDPSTIERFVSPIQIALNELNQLQRAHQLAQDSVEKFPTEAMSHNLLAWTHFERGEYEEAFIQAELAIKIDSNLADAHYHLARVHEAQSNLDGAQNAYKQAYQLASNTNDIKNLAAQAYNDIVLALETQINQ